MSIWVRHWHSLPLFEWTVAKTLFLRTFLGSVLQDTAGQERYRTITPPFFRGAQGVILGTCSPHLRLSPLAHRNLCHTCNVLVYDVSNRESFEALPRWLEELENYVPPEVVKIVVGNKLDKVKK
jgi:Ras-related protein Rab-18